MRGVRVGTERRGGLPAAGPVGVAVPGFSLRRVFCVERVLRLDGYRGTGRLGPLVGVLRPPEFLQRSGHPSPCSPGGNAPGGGRAAAAPGGFGGTEPSEGTPLGHRPLLVTVSVTPGAAYLGHVQSMQMHR